MADLTNDEQIKYLDFEAPWFFHWRQRSEFSSHIEDVDRKISNCIIFNHNKAKWLREALTLAEYAILAGVDRLKLNKSDPPDGYVFRDGREIPVEITEVLEVGRRRGEEYKNCSVPSDGEIGDWTRRAGAIGKALRGGISKKATVLGQNSDAELLVYLNISSWGIRQLEIEAEIRSILHEVQGRPPVKVLWNGKLYE